MKFLAQTVSGLEEVAAYHLQQEGFADYRLLGLEDGLVLFETKTFPDRLPGLRYLNNSFQIVAQHRLKTGQGVDALLRWLVAREDWHAPLKRSIFPRERSFRLVLSHANHLVAGDNQSIGRLGSIVETVTGLAWNARGADCELWAVVRNNGEAYFSRRLSRRTKTERDLDAGELRPELATLLCLISEPDAKDIVLDPFAGSGAVPFARAQLPYNMIFAFDADEAKAEALKLRIRSADGVKVRKGSPLIARQADATQLARIDDGFVTKVVTDPPWGLFDKGIDDPRSFYRGVLAEMVRVVSPGGIVVMLLGDRSLARDMADEFAQSLSTEARYDILVSGKKAVVMKWRKGK